MGKSNRTSFTLVKTLSIFYLFIFVVSTISMFFIFSNEILNTILSVFLIKDIFNLSFLLVFDQSSSIAPLIFILLSILGLIVSNILMIFTKWGIIFPTAIFFTDIFYQLSLIIKATDNIHNGWYIFGIILEIIGILLMITYFIKASKKQRTL